MKGRLSQFKRNRAATRTGTETVRPRILRSAATAGTFASMASNAASGTLADAMSDIVVQSTQPKRKGVPFVVE